MYGIFTQGRNGFTWCASEATHEAAVAAADDFKARDDVDFVLVIKIEHLLDVDSNRVG